MKKLGDGLAYMAALLLLGYTWTELVPHGFLSSLGQPAHLATLGGIAGLVVLVACATFPPSDPKLTQSLVAQVLVSMPLIYIWGAVQTGSAAAIALEVLGLVIFGAVAAFAYFRKPELLGVAVMSHGLLWDSWHHSHSSVLPPWYPLACLLYDIAFGLVVMTRFRGAALPAPGVVRVVPS